MTFDLQQEVSPWLLAVPLRKADSEFFLDEVMVYITRTALTYATYLLYCHLTALTG